MSTSQQHKRGKTVKGLGATEKVVVAVKASKEIPKTALVWALTHIVQPGDCIMLLVVVPPHSSGTILTLYLSFVFISLFFCSLIYLS